MIQNLNKNLFYLLALGIFIASCSKDDESNSPKLTAYNESVVRYFEEVALGFEFGNASEITRRWEGNMKIFIGGQITPELLAETNKIINEINDLSTTEFMIELVSDTLQSNFYIYFGSGDSYARIFPSLSNLVVSNWALFNVFWDGSNTLVEGYMYVDVRRADLTEQKHLLREELTQSLGLARDSYLYSESIFQQSFLTKTTEYAPIDRDLVRLLYHPRMMIGLNRNQVDDVLRAILFDEQ
jgi:hypothetical protein